MLWVLVAVALGSLILGFTAARAISIRKESAMANNSAVLRSYIAATTAALKAKDDEIALLKAKDDPDLAADEQAINDGVAALQAAGIALPPETTAAEPVA